MAHTLPLDQPFVREYGAGLTASVVLHGALLLLLVVNLDLLPAQETKPVRLAIQATIVDPQAVTDRRRREALRADIRREQEVQAAAEQARQAAVEKRAEQERERQAADRARADDARRAREAAAAEQKRKAEASRKSAEAARSRQAAADLERVLREEEQLMAAEDSGLLDQYAEIIAQKVIRNWFRPASAREGLACIVQVKQIPSGEVIDVRVTECNGDATVVRSIEAAVLRASPLPPPPDRSLFDRSIRFEFRPRD
ncbi:MAG: cell envelope integrity protein TolA [Gammaproteobacteria bacterium]|nr:cell envelope integrity protein TolA [Gammaproteobacteria bacterium]